jgi:hypothetical protein
MNRKIALALLLATALAGTASASILNPNAQSVGGWSYDETYDNMMDALYAGRAVQQVGEKLWVPWYSTSSSCAAGATR